ncbi:MAG: hypothetical protein ACYCY3_03055, partial [Halothiobacillus sp.]
NSSGLNRNGQQRLDSQLGVFLSQQLKLVWRHITATRMDTFGVVKIDVFLGDPSAFLWGFEFLVMLGFNFETSEGPFHDDRLNSPNTPARISSGCSRIRESPAA